MDIFEDRKKLEIAEEQKFIEKCRREFIEQSLITANKKRVDQLTLVSYLPNFLSAVTAGFFIFYLLSNYSFWIKITLGGLLSILIFSIEFGKRSLISSIAKEYFINARIAFLIIMGLIACFGLSMTASYFGGQYLVVETVEAPTMVINPEIESINKQIALEQETINRLQKTTWKGKITRAANKGINDAKGIQTGLYERLYKLQEQNEESFQIDLMQFNSKNLNFGILLGVLAALSDLFLLGLLWTAKRLKYQVAELSQINTTGIGFLKGQSHSYQIPSIQNEVRDLNKDSKRKIGFEIPVRKEQTTETRITEEPKSKANSANTGNRVTENRTDNNTVTLIEKEVIELTDRVKDCLHCGERFAYYNSRAKYCSDRCRISAWEKRTGKILKRKGNK